MKVSARRIIAAVSEAWDLPPDVLMSRRRGEDTAIARQSAYYLGHRLTGFTQGGLARQFHRDRQSVAYGIRRVEERRAADPAFADRLDEIEADLSRDWVKAVPFRSFRASEARP